MGKSMENLQCHRIYIQHIWRYGSRFLTPISGCSIRVYLILSSWYKNPSKQLETLVSYVIPYCETSPTQIDIWEFAPSHRCRFPDNFLLLWAPARCAWWFDGFAEGRNPWIWKTSHLLRRTSSCWQNFHWFIILIGCWFHPQTLVYHGKAPAVTSWSIISPTAIDI